MTLFVRPLRTFAGVHDIAPAPKFRARQVARTTKGSRISDFDSSRPTAYPGTPGAGYQDAAGSPPADNLAWAILAVFCFWPLGIASVVNAAKVNGLWANGDVEGARQASRKAKHYAIWSAVVAGACVCFGVGLTVLAIMSPAPGS